MHVVRQHAAWPEQPAPVVGVGVVRVLREQPAHGVDLGAVLVDVRGEQRAVDVAEHRRARLQHRLAGGQREPRRDGVAQPILAVPPRRERDRVGVRLLRGGQQLGAQQPVADDEPGADPQPDRRRPLEELVDRGREVRTEHERGRRPRTQQPVDELRGHRPRVVGRGHPGLLRQRALRQPVEQRHAEAADHPHLREVHVGVDQAGQQHATGQVDHLVVRSCRPHPGERPAVDDGPRGDGDAAVVLGAQPATGERRVRGVEDGRAVDRHETTCSARSRCVVVPLEPHHQVRRHTDRDRRRVLPGDLRQADRRGDPGQRRGPVPLRGQLLLEPPPLRRRPDQPDRAQVPAPQRRVAQRGVLGVVVGHDQHVAAGGQLAEHQLGHHRVVEVHPGQGVRGGRREPLRVDLGGAGVDQVQLQVVPGQDPGQLEADVPHPEDRDGGHRAQRLEQQRHLAAAALHAVPRRRPLGEAGRLGLRFAPATPAARGPAAPRLPRGCRRRSCPSSGR